MWGVGCVFYELLEMIKENQSDLNKRSALFPGNSCFPLSPSKNPTGTASGLPNSPQDQLVTILNIYGIPNSSDLNFLNDQRAEDYVKEISKNKTKTDIKIKLPAANKYALDLLKKLLVFNPYYRITAKEALKSPYFDEVRNKSQEIEMPQPIVLLTDTANAGNLQILTAMVLQKIMIRWTFM